jgi:Uma2 family endonuclease
MTVGEPRRTKLRRALLPFDVDAEQTMGMPATHSQRYTAADVLAMPEQPGKTIEVIDGELFVTPSPNWGHQGVTQILSAALFNYTRSQRVGITRSSPADIIPEPDTLVQPDVFVVPLIDGRGPTSWSEIKTLMLAIEVLSPSTERRDRVAKRHLYARMGCEYWIVNPNARVVERWLPNEARPEICETRLTWKPVGAAATFEIDLEAMFAEAIEGTLGEA